MEEKPLARFYNYEERIFVFFDGKRYCFPRKTVNEAKKSSYFSNSENLDCGVMTDPGFVPEGFKFKEHDPDIE